VLGLNDWTIPIEQMRCPRGCCRSRSVRDSALEPAEAVGVEGEGEGAGGGAACEVEVGDVGYC
jgi:hypothetical protein